MTVTTLAISFLVPGLAIAGAAAVAIPVIIHILSRRPRRPMEWAAMRFLLAAYRRHRTRTRIEQLLLLACRCAIVLLLGLALAGPLLDAAGALGELTSRGRVLVIVLDDSVASKAVDPATGKPRFDSLKKMAANLIDGLGQGDRVALVTAARPSAAIIAPPTNDPTAVRNRITQHEATDAAADLGGALALAQSAIEDLDEKPRSIYVALLSDFARGSVPLDQQLPEQLAKLGEAATLLRPAPAESVANVQIESLAPDRRAVIRQTADEQATVEWNIRLRRFSGPLAAGELTRVRLSVPGIAPVAQNVTWAQGQSVTDVQFNTPLTASGSIGAEAVLEQTATGADALSADNTRHALVRVRQKLSVVVVDQPGPARRLEPRYWLDAALTVDADKWNWPIEIKVQDPATIAAPSSVLGEADAIYVLRPDLLDEGGWAAIKGWLASGGLAWFVPPAGDAPPIWASRLTETFALPWEIAGDAVVHSPALGVKTDAPTPRELSRLAANLPDLLRAIEVTRRLPISPASLGGGSEVLVEGIDGSPLVIGASLAGGGGRVLLSAVAFHTDWTNLPTKPMFVPLNHEVLRAAIDLLQPELTYEPGEQPALGRAFARVPSLRTPAGDTLLLVPSKTADGDELIRPIRPFDRIGHYESDTEALAVNVLAAAGDTLATEPAMLDAWLGSIGTWQPLDRAAPQAVFKATAERSDWTWPLLWALLVFALIETFLARHVSHASAMHRSESATRPLTPGESRMTVTE